MPTIEERLDALTDAINALAAKVEIARRLDGIDARLAGIETQLVLGGKILAHLVQQGGEMSIEMDAVRTEVATINDVVTALESEVVALANRLTDNATPGEITAVAEALRGIGSKLSPLKEAVKALDPDVPTGPIVDTGDPADTDPGDTADEGGGV